MEWHDCGFWSLPWHLSSAWPNLRLWGLALVHWKSPQLTISMTSRLVKDTASTLTRCGSRSVTGESSVGDDSGFRKGSRFECWKSKRLYIEMWKKQTTPETLYICMLYLYTYMKTHYGTPHVGKKTILTACLGTDLFGSYCPLLWEFEISRHN